jgi:hypothetical protein
MGQTSAGRHIGRKEAPAVKNGEGIHRRLRSRERQMSTLTKRYLLRQAQKTQLLNHPVAHH